MHKHKHKHKIVKSERWKCVVVLSFMFLVSIYSLSHGNKEFFSCLGIQLAVNFFLDRGHSDVTAFVPSWRKEQPRPDVPITGMRTLRRMW